MNKKCYVISTSLVFLLSIRLVFSSFKNIFYNVIYLKSLNVSSFTSNMGFL